MNRFFPFVFSLFLLGCTQPPAPVVNYGKSAGEGSAGVHSVVEGDTLWSISQRYKIVMRDIAAVNNLSAPFVLSSGQRIKLPPPLNYKVKAGDSLYTVSRVFGVGTSELAQINGLSAPYTLRVGQDLKLPSVTSSRVAVASSSSASAQGTYAKPRPGSKPKQVTSARKPKITARTPKRASGKFMRPVEGRLVSSYGPKRGGLHNDGINIAAAHGAPVKAAENGVVVYAGNELKGSGNLVLIRHENRWMTAYAHMDKTLIKRGQIVKRGQKIGTVGSTGSVDKPQLHFEVRRGTDAINPKLYLEG